MPCSKLGMLFVTPSVTVDSHLIRHLGLVCAMNRLRHLSSLETDNGSNLEATIVEQRD
jgi:hypothetical protein